MKKTSIAFALISIAITVPAAPAVRLRVDGVPEDETPSFTHGERVEVVAENVSGAPIEGAVTLKVGRWDGEEALSVPCGDLDEWHNCVLICIFLIMSAIEHLFMLLLAIYMSSLCGNSDRFPLLGL